jgi:uncharacterized protein
MTDMKSNPVGWFEIPVLDMDRAITFYETVFGYTLERHPMGPLDMAWFPRDPEARGASGALVKHEEWYKPTLDGPLLYFTSPSGDLSNELEKIESAGGKIWIQRKLISDDYGYMAVFSDTEGNRIAIHSRK